MSSKGSNYDDGDNPLAEEQPQPDIPANQSMPAESTGSGWPSVAAKLFMPMQWKLPPDDTSTCTIEYDATRKLLKVLNEQQSVVDIINPLDIIGIDVEIKLFDAATGDEFKGERPSAFKNKQDRTAPGSPVEPTTDMVVEPSGCNIFDSVAQNNDHIFSCISKDFGDDDHDTTRNDHDNNLIPVDSHATAVLNLYTYPKSKDASYWFCRNTDPLGPQPHYEEGDGPRQAHPYAFPVTAAHDFEHLTLLVKAIRRVALLPPTKPKYLILVNPESGTKQAPMVWKNIVQPMLEKEAGVDMTVIGTDHAGHGLELMMKDEEDRKLLDYDAVICLGGDGVLHEVLQGWQARPDFKKVLQKVRLGILGCGTGNGLAKSLTFEANEHWSMLESTFLIARCQTIWIDLSKYSVQDKTYTSFLTFSWAMIADIDIDSECIRFLGALRNDIWGVRCVAGMRTYRGRLSYLPPDAADKNAKTLKETEPIVLPALTEPLPEDRWKVIEDDFLLLWASQVPYAAQTNYSSPPSSLQDGVFQILVVRGKHIGRIAMATILLGLDSGGHANHPEAEFIECVAYRLEPLTEGSHNALDGEVVENGPIQAHIMPGALQVFGASKKETKSRATLTTTTTTAK